MSADTTSPKPDDGITHSHDVKGVIVEVFGGIERLALGLGVESLEKLIRVPGHTAFVVFQSYSVVSVRSRPPQRIPSLRKAT